MVCEAARSSTIIGLHLRMHQAVVAVAVLAMSTMVALAGDADASPLPAGETIELQIGGRSGVPADAIAVALNITAVGPDNDGYVTVWPCGQSRPTTSSLNGAAAENVANLVVSKIGALGRVCIFSQSRADIVADVAGYFPATSDFRPLETPSRLVDTRNSAGDVPSAQILRVQVGGGGMGAVPPDASAVTLNVTAVAPAGPGFATVWPCDLPRPTASNLNYTTGRTVANLVMSKLAGDGSACIFTQQSADFVVDASGYFPFGSSYGTLVNPQRLLDTRIGLGAPLGRVAAGGSIELAVGGHASVPSGARAVTLNVAAVNPTGAGYATVWPCGQPRPTASNLNYGNGQTVANLTIATLGEAGSVCIFSQQEADYIADVAGYLPTADGYIPLNNPARFLDSRDCRMSSVAVLAPPWGTVEALTPLVSGELVVGGSRATSNPFPNDREMVVGRLLAAGTLDPSFGASGFTVVPTSGTIDDAAHQLVVDAAGRILIRGNDRIVRLTPEGALDITFNNPLGYVSLPLNPGPLESPTQIAVEPDGRIVIAAVSGASPGDETLHRLNPDGSPDPTFTPPSAAQLRSILPPPTASPLEAPQGLDVAESGKIVVARGRNVVRLLPGGSIDDSFGTDGVSVVAGDVVRVFAIAADQTLVLTSNSIVRLDANGELDTSYGDAGAAAFSEPVTYLPGELFAPVTEIVPGAFRHAAIVDSDGSIEGIAQFKVPYVHSGFTQYVSAVYRLRADGWPDGSFGIGGRATIDVPKVDVVAGVPADAALVAGGGLVFSVPGAAVTRGDLRQACPSAT